MLTSPSNAQLLSQLAPLLMGLGGLVIFRERYTLAQWVALGILCLGFVFSRTIFAIISRNLPAQ